MKKLQNRAFTLVELLVVITILAIISVVAYQNFGSAVGKAVSGRKIQDISTIETSLSQYKIDKNYYPTVDTYNNTTNMWGYSSGTTANISNTLIVSKTGEEVTAINSANGGGIVYGTGTWNTIQIGAKGTISQETLGKQYLTKDLYDPEIGDIKVGSKKMIDSGIGRYVYAVFKKPLPSDTTWGTNNKTGTYYNIAYTIKKEGSDIYLTKIVGDYDEKSCFDDSSKCKKTLIGLDDGQEQTSSNTSNVNQGIPYPVDGF
ncbi:MAG: type II secretion system protein [Candidatus Gracilibacteria bacterium]|nr:type II secretion system protein [Candidatus Gracilibacteria bacterium]